MNKVSILGTGSYVPETIISNDDLSKIVDTNDEWITTRTGIKERHISNGELTWELGAKAVLSALESSGKKPEDVDLIICATITPDEMMPATACRIQSAVGAVNAAAFDISAACSGMVFGINIATQFIKTGMYKTVCVVGAETLSKVVDWTDRGTCVLFGDGAGAVIMGNDESATSEIVSQSMVSNGSKGDILTLNSFPFKNTLIDKTEDFTDAYMHMDGQEVFKFAVKIMANQVEKVAEDAGVTLEDVKYIVPHQANIRIIALAAKTLGIPQDKFVVNLHKYGNTSSASIGIALDELMKSGNVNTGDKIILTGFGGGMSAGAVLITM